MIKITDKQTVRLTFTHVKGGEASLFIAMNPLSGDWLQYHSHNGKSSGYYGTKSDALSLANSIVKKSKKAKLPCKVVIESVK